MSFKERSTLALPSSNRFQTLRDIKSNDQALLLRACGVTLETMFQQTVDNAQPSGNVTVSVNTLFGIKHLEATLISEHYTVIQKYEKREGTMHSMYACAVNDSSGVVSAQKYTLMTILALKAFAYIFQPDLDEGLSVYLCNHCKPKIKGNIMPARCVLNGLETVSLPKELEGLDLFSLQLIQLAKTFQTVIKLKTYSNK